MFVSAFLPRYGRKLIRFPQILHRTQSDTINYLLLLALFALALCVYGLRSTFLFTVPNIYSSGIVRSVLFEAVMNMKHYGQFGYEKYCTINK